ncbi:MAG: imidazole glycerol phosphate synthase subunit HisH [Oscillospiraceae bacterium]|nr:imidazole glycerol phosphate synthase subunit HisH [Oscillospiraceae bacterium]
MIKIIDYKAGNAPSVLNAVTHLGFEAQLTRNLSDLDGASHIILPGVGSAKATMESLDESNLLEALQDAVIGKQIPFLGICVGMQILFQHSAEGDADCFAWLKGNVIKFDSSKVRVPQMGWNQVRFIKDSAIDAENDYFYFVNSYYAVPEDNDILWGIADYGGDFAAAVCKENIYGMQFHAEKSGEAGLALLNGFLEIK